jgi:hypothetical protein
MSKEPATPDAAHFTVVFVMPVYRDWESAALVCQELDRLLAGRLDVTAQVLLVDDGSPDGLNGWGDLPIEALTQVEVLHLHRNMGHQRAIALALCHIHQHVPCDAVLVMDADGEDRPEDALRLVDMAIDASVPAVIFAERGKRLENATFQLGYRTYRILHRLLTGIGVRVGNFSIVPRAFLSRLVVMAELGNHYAATVFKSKLPFVLRRIDRGPRLRGQSRMNFVALVVHGLSALATFQEVMATRLLIASVFAALLAVLLACTVAGIRFGTSMAVPGWATMVVGLLAVVLIQIVATAFTLVFFLLANRSNMSFLPIRDYSIFVARCDRIARRNERRP